MHFEKLFNIVRVIDPEKKQVVLCNESGEFGRMTCYDFWKKEEFCCNCVASKAMPEQDTFMKVEYQEGKVFLILASPVQIKDELFVVEMLKDITESGLPTNLCGNDIKGTNQLISELNEKIMIDELTGWYNRRFLRERLPQEIFYAYRKKRSLAVLMIDIDSFKQVNDTYGHLAGDLVLQELSNMIKIGVGKENWVIRFGGEEFLIIFPQAEYQMVYDTAEHLRREWEAYEVRYIRHSIKTTISIGGYILQSEKMDTDEILACVDKNLYQAKKDGRNRVILS